MTRAVCGYVQSQVHTQVHVHKRIIIEPEFGHWPPGLSEAGTVCRGDTGRVCCWRMYEIIFVCALGEWL